MYTYMEPEQFAKNRGRISFVEDDGKLRVAGAPSYFRLEGSMTGDDLYLDFFEGNRYDLIYRGRLQGRLSEGHG